MRKLGSLTGLSEGGELILGNVIEKKLSMERGRKGLEMHDIQG